MAHTYAFNPPVRCRGGPVLALRLGDPMLEKTLSGRILQGAQAPYRRSRDVENLLDDITFRVKPATRTDALLMVSLGLSAGRKTKFEFSHGHTHRTGELMSPDVLLSHSGAEGGRTVQIAVMEELRVLAVALLRELGYSSYLSVIRAADGTAVSGLVVISDDSAQSFVINGNHPALSELTVFEDSEALDILRLLRARNGLRLLFDEIKDGSRISSAEEARYRHLISEFAVSAQSAHHLVTLVEEVFVAFAERFPELLAPKRSSS